MPDRGPETEDEVIVSSLHRILQNSLCHSERGEGSLVAGRGFFASLRMTDARRSFASHYLFMGLVPETQLGIMPLRLPAQSKYNRHAPLCRTWRSRRSSRYTTIAKSPLLPVILSGAKNPTISTETFRSARCDNLLDFAISLRYHSRVLTAIFVADGCNAGRAAIAPSHSLALPEMRICWTARWKFCNWPLQG